MNDSISILTKKMEITLPTYQSLKSFIQVKPIQSILRSHLKALQVQLKSVIEMFSKDLPQVYVEITEGDDKGEKSTLFIEEIKNIVRNVIQFHSLVLDASIIKLIQEYNEDKPIALFVGLNHAFRLAHILGWSVDNSFDKYKASAMKTLTPSVFIKDSDESKVDASQVEGRKISKKKNKKRKTKKNR